MVKLEAIIQPQKLDGVREALESIGVQGVTVSEVRGHGRQKGHTEVYRGREYQIDLLPKVKIELVISEDRQDEVVETLMEAARTGAIGDGKIFLSPVNEAIRIRDNTRGDAAL
jgi:nitrogen regulatory protein P-II 1